MWGVSSTPTTVISSPAARPKARAVWTAVVSRWWSLAPKYLEISTPAPMAMPLRKPTSMKIRFPEELTAARASLPIKLPTIRVSAVL